MWSIDLKGKVALVTGGTRGIGAGISMMLAKAGAVVAMNYRSDEDSARALGNEAEKLKLKVFSIKGDVSDFVQAEQMVQEVVDRVGHLDILVNNAGIADPMPIDHPRAEQEWDKILNANLKGTFNMCVHATPELKRRTLGKIINISSTSGQKGSPKYSHYAASKGGMISLTKSLAVELAEEGVLVNAVAPGYTRTDLTKNSMSDPKKLQRALDQIPLGKVAEADDVAGAVPFSSIRFSKSYHRRNHQRQRWLCSLRVDLYTGVDRGEGFSERVVAGFKKPCICYVH